MKTSTLALIYLIGLICTMSFVGVVPQPDWSFAILAGVLLSRKRAWVWVLPCAVLHDLLLYWSVWVMFPYIAATSSALFYTDKRLGSGQQQRWFCMGMLTVGLLFSGLDWVSIILTVTLSVWLWLVFSSKREKVYVEPA